MAVANRLLIEHVAPLAGLTYAWCEEAMRLLAVEDVSGVVGTELSRLEKQNATKAGPAAIGLANRWDKEKVRAGLQGKAHNLYATSEVRPLLLESLTLACWDGVVGHARKDNRFGTNVPLGTSEFESWLTRGGAHKRGVSDEEIHRLWVQRQIGLQLGTDASSIGRWENYKSVPGGEKVLGAILIALQDEIGGIPLPDRRSLLTQAACRTLAFIREGRYGKQASKRPDRLPTPEELAVVRAVLRHEFADAFLTPAPHDGPRQSKLLADVGSAIKAAFPHSEVWKPSNIRRLNWDWSMHYAHFRIALVSGWPNGTEDEWNWSEIDDDEEPL